MADAKAGPGSGHVVDSSHGCDNHLSDVMLQDARSLI